MKYAYYKTDGTAEVIETSEPIKYEQLSELVGGSIEAYRTQQGQMVYLNEEGRLIGLESNPFYSEDIKGNVLEYSHVDDEGETIGFGDDLVLRETAKLPAQLFEKGKQFTLFWISDSWGATVDSEIKVTGDSNDGKPVFVLKGKRKRVLWSAPTSQIMIFEGWDLPIINAMNLTQKDGVFTQSTIRMNAMYNLAGLPVEEMAEYIEQNQLNPFFIAKDHILHVSEDKVETLVFPHAPATNQRIADMQSAQLKDGVDRIVIR